MTMRQDQTACGDADAPATGGLVGYLDGEPVGWVAVEPRTAYPSSGRPGSPGAVAPRTRATTVSGR
jgi:hypothetical protein